MAASHTRRKRKINVEDLTLEQIDDISITLGEEVAKVMDEANKKCNKLLNIYGLQTKIGYEMVPYEKPKKVKKTK